MLNIACAAICTWMNKASKSHVTDEALTSAYDKDVYAKRRLNMRTHIYMYRGYGNTYAVVCGHITSPAPQSVPADIYIAVCGHIYSGMKTHEMGCGWSLNRALVKP
jgi:hypothetical protein